jgi:hypothetical protein
VQISRERQAAIDAEKQRLALSIADTLNSAKATAQILARKRGWYPNEANFVSSATDTASITASQRPRDYFAVYWLADVRSTDNTPASNAEAANLYLKASKLVPPDPSYNLFRDIAIQGYREVTGRQR